MREPTRGTRRPSASGTANAGTRARGSVRRAVEPIVNVPEIAKYLKDNPAAAARLYADAVRSGTSFGASDVADAVKRKDAVGTGLALAGAVPAIGVPGKVASAASKVARVAKTASTASKAAAAAKAPVKTAAMINKQRRASVAAIAKRTGSPAPKIGLEKGTPAARKPTPAKSGPTVPPNSTPKPRATKPVASRKPTTKPVAKPKRLPIEPEEADFASKTAYNAAMTTWKKKVALIERANRTPLQVEREAAAVARAKAAGAGRGTGGDALTKPAKGSAEARVQTQAAKTEGKKVASEAQAKSLMKPSAGDVPKATAKPNRSSRYAARPAKGTRGPVRSRYKTQAGYDKALAKWKASDTAGVPKRPANAAAKPASKVKDKTQNTPIGDTPVPFAPIPKVLHPSDAYRPMAASAKAKPGAPKAPAPKKPTAKKPAASKPGTDVATLPKPTAPKPAAPKKPAGKKPAAKKPTAKKPGTDVAVVPKGAVTEGARKPPVREPIDIKATPVKPTPNLPARTTRPPARPSRPAPGGRKPAAIGAGPKPSAPKKPGRKKKIAAGIAGAAAVATAAVVSGDREKSKAAAATPASKPAASSKPASKRGYTGVDKYGRKISKAEYNRRLKEKEERMAAAYNPAERMKLYKEQVARRKKYRQKAGTKAYGASATTKTKEPAVKVGQQLKKIVKKYK